MKITRFGPTDAGQTAGSGNAAGPAGGDLGGGYPAPTVTGIDGKSFSSPGTEANGSVPTYNAGTGTWDWTVPGAGSPLTTKGDLHGYSTVDARVPVGVDGYPLIAASAVGLGVQYGAISVVAAYPFHSESLTDGASNFIFAAGDVVTVVGVPN